jgi:hypothetical protein
MFYVLFGDGAIFLAILASLAQLAERGAYTSLLMRER